MSFLFLSDSGLGEMLNTIPDRLEGMGNMVLDLDQSLVSALDNVSSWHTLLSFMFQ